MATLVSTAPPMPFSSKIIAVAPTPTTSAICSSAPLTSWKSSTANSLQRVLARVESKEGSLGRAIADSSLYIEMHETLHNTNELVKDIRKNPKRYFKVGIF